MRLFRQISRFGLVGIVATGCHVAVGLVLHEAVGFAATTANAIAFLTALAVSFLGQTRITFAGVQADAPAFLRFAFVAVMGLAANQAIVWVVTRLLDGSYRAALAIIILTVPGATFLVLKYWAFKEHAPGRTHPPLQRTDPGMG